MPSSRPVDKFYTPDEVRAVARRAALRRALWSSLCPGPKFRTLRSCAPLRLEVAQQLGLRGPKRFAPLWVVDSPGCSRWDDETQRFAAMHHPFHRAQTRGRALPRKRPGRVRANVYTFVCNGPREWRRLDPYPRSQICRPRSSLVPGLHAREGAGAVRFPDERLQVRASSRRPGLRVRPSVLAVRRLRNRSATTSLSRRTMPAAACARCAVGHPLRSSTQELYLALKAPGSEIGGWRRRSSGEDLRRSAVPSCSTPIGLLSVQTSGTDQNWNVKPSKRKNDDTTQCIYPHDGDQP